jgi:hypothetical protein
METKKMNKEQIKSLYRDFNITSVSRADLVDKYGEETAWPMLIATMGSGLI